MYLLLSWGKSYKLVQLTQIVNTMYFATVYFYTQKEVNNTVGQKKKENRV